MTELLIVFVTCENKQQAETLGASVVSEKLAACVNVVPGIRSCYVWEGKLTWSDELLLVMKTSRSAFERLKQRVAELHSYEVPEIIAMPVEAGLDKYLEWASGNIQ